MSAGRKYLTPREKAEIWQAQNGLCACGCAEPLIEGQVDWDHRIANLRSALLALRLSLPHRWPERKFEKRTKTPPAETQGRK